MLSDPAPLKMRFVTPNPVLFAKLFPLKMPAMLTALVRLTIIVPRFCAPAGNTAAFAVFHTTVEAVNVELVAHCAVVVFHVPLVGTEAPFGSQ